MPADVCALVTRPHDKYCIKLCNPRLPEASQYFSTEQPLPPDNIRWLLCDPCQDKPVLLLFSVSFFHPPRNWNVGLVFSSSSFFLLDCAHFCFYIFSAFLWCLRCYARTGLQLMVYIGRKCRAVYGDKRPLNGKREFLHLIWNKSLEPLVTFFREFFSPFLQPKHEYYQEEVSPICDFVTFCL